MFFYFSPFLSRRLEAIIPEMDSSHNLMVVAHQVVIRCLFSFFFRTPAENIPYEKIPLHTLMKITYDPVSGTNTVEKQSFGIEAVDTYRPRADPAELKQQQEMMTTTTPTKSRSPSKTPSPGNRSFKQSLDAGGSKLIA